jgi:pilus assembly protein Flp/PilA
MNKVIRIAKGVIREDDGASMVEYAIGVAFIAALLVVAVAAFTDKLDGVFNAIGADLDDAASQ